MPSGNLKNVVLKTHVFFTLSLFVQSTCFSQYNIDAYLSKARNYISNQNYTDAIQKLNICIDAEPRNLEAYYYRGISKYLLADNTGAELDLTVAVSNVSSVYYDALHARSQVSYLLGNLQSALDDINKLIEKQNNNPKFYLERAFIQLSSSKYQLAIDECNKAMNLHLVDQDVLHCKAVAEDAIGDYQNALNDYDLVIKINPVSKETFVRRGITKNKMENYTGAMADYNHAIELDSAFTYAYYNRAETLIKLNKNKDALSDYTIVIQYEPRNAYAYFNRAVLQANLKMPQKAIADFNTVLGN